MNQQAHLAQPVATGQRGNQFPEPETVVQVVLQPAVVKPQPLPGLAHQRIHQRQHRRLVIKGPAAFVPLQNQGRVAVGQGRHRQRRCQAAHIVMGDAGVLIGVRAQVKAGFLIEEDGVSLRRQPDFLKLAGGVGHQLPQQGFADALAPVFWQDRHATDVGGFLQRAEQPRDADGGVVGQDRQVVVGDVIGGIPLQLRRHALFLDEHPAADVADVTGASCQLYLRIRIRGMAYSKYTEPWLYRAVISPSRAESSARGARAAMGIRAPAHSNGARGRASPRRR